MRRAYLCLSLLALVLGFLLGCGTSVNLPSDCWWGGTPTSPAIFCTSGHGFTAAQARYPGVPVHYVNPNRY